MTNKKLQVVEKNDKTIALQSNEISQSIYSCSPMARRLIGFCISNCYEDKSLVFLPVSEFAKENPKTFPCHKSEFSISEFINRLEMDKGTKQMQLVRNAVDELSKSRIIVKDTPKQFHAYSWFNEAFYSEDEDKIQLTFNPMTFAAVTAWVRRQTGYSTLRLELLGQLRSFYAMRYYEMALSTIGYEGKAGNNKGEWFFEKSISELRTMFEIKENAYKGRTNKFIFTVVKNPIDELNSKNKDFQIEVVKIREGRKTVGFRFICSRTTEPRKIHKNDTFEDRQAKAEMNEIEVEIAFYKTKFRKLWDEQYNIISQQGNLFQFEFSKETETLSAVKTILAEKKKT